jgi:hypothetical protein
MPLVFSQVSDAHEPLRGTNTSRPAKPLRRVTGRRLGLVQRNLSERDWQVLRLVEQHRYLSSSQLQGFAFRNHDTPASAARTTRRVLAQLEDLQLLRPLLRRVGGVRGGSSATIWQLAPAGVRLLTTDTGQYRTHEPSPRFLRHALAVADVHLHLRGLVETGALESASIELEPACWRRYTGPGGEVRWLQPDLSASLTTQRYVDRWFIEVDLATESLPTLLRKCHAYEHYRAAGQEQSAAGVFPLVLWIMNQPRRVEQLRGAIARARGLAPELFRVVTTDTLDAAVRGAAP